MSRTTKRPAPTLREIRADHFEVERDGKRIGSLSQTPLWADRHAGRWTLWLDGQPPTPTFPNLDAAKEHVADL